MIDPAALELLKTRKSPKVFDLAFPAPNTAELDSMLAIASRVPDHGKLTPWRFVIFEGEARERAGEVIAAVFREDQPDADADRVDIERTRLARAPVVIAVVSKAGPHAKIPEWEQTLSGAASCTLLVLAAHAHGYAATWLTEWYAYDPRVRAGLGLAENERIIGFVHMGTLARPQEDRPRPALADLVLRY
ncbi:nitroreductase [Ancylobacter dichloromethanicus]|uniref:Putative NAD(P)H nitroreductase n=1 Tax=Ancylobacter dichloromethanicus TaxID=518825 RepID=A0A9W6JAI5_9HYPH|nr:nitroreductase [Ancylobacter dichloromethanicus]MBS7554779.1 nitroreductase [Ancylobacter dichloromethanicus]GLK72464.1 nitroreductase [Ancylobacter dichloromethanicus]